MIDAADYSGYFQVDLIGAYRVKVKAETKAGTEEILDGFTAVADRPFDIERSGPTRIFPLADYEMKIVIRANEDFQGEVAEYVPEGFQISNVKFQITNDECRMTNNALDNNENCNRHSIRQPADDIRQAEDGQAIVFSDIDLRAGEEAEITYIFDAPDVSPQFYLLGPLGLFNDNSSFDIGHS